MTVTNYNQLNRHTGHKIEVVNYAEQNVAIECVECGEVLKEHENGGV